MTTKGCGYRVRNTGSQRYTTVAAHSDVSNRKCTNTDMLTFGRDMEKQLFRHEPGATFLNHGSWGAVPRPVYDERLRLLDVQESAPDRWFRWRMADLWKDNLEAACRFVGAQPQNTAFVANATSAVNTVLKSLPLKAGDAILIYSWTYQAVKTTCDATAQRTGAEVLSVDIKIPIKSRQDVVEKYRDMLDAHTNVKVAVLDLISSPTATVMPYLELTELCRERGVLVLLDGAHGPGQVPLNLEKLGANGVDFFTGNFHKWVYTPRGCAILWVHPKHHKVVRPAITGTNLNRDIWQEDFMTQGTIDNTTFFTCKKATEFYNGIGGMEAIVGYNSRLADEAVALLTAAWGTSKFPIPNDMEAPCMRVVKLPDLSQFPAVQDPEAVFGDMLALMATLADRFRIYAVTLFIHGEPWVRISAQVYNTLDDYRKMADAVLTLLLEGASGDK